MTISAGRFRIGPGSGHLVLRLSRQGLGSTLGQDLTLEVTDWSAQLDVPGDPADGALLTARFELASLTVPDGNGALLTGPVRREIEENARRSLGVADHPTATFESREVAPVDGGGAINGTLTLRGVPVPTEMRVRELGPARYRATAVVSQSAHGIKPYSTMLGTLRLRDDVQVELEIDLDAAERTAIDGHRTSG
jgi:polyisoprenoid-binding protein YceI